MQGFRILVGEMVAIVISALFNAGYPAPANQDNVVASTVPEADVAWQVILMIGALPALLTYYWRMKMPETARYTTLVAKNAKKAAIDMSTVLQTKIETSKRKF